MQREATNKETSQLEPNCGAVICVMCYISYFILHILPASLKGETNQLWHLWIDECFSSTSTTHIFLPVFICIVFYVHVCVCILYICTENTMTTTTGSSLFFFSCLVYERRTDIAFWCFLIKFYCRCTLIFCCCMPLFIVIVLWNSFNLNVYVCVYFCVSSSYYSQFSAQHTKNSLFSFKKRGVVLQFFFSNGWSSIVCVLYRIKT